MIENLFNRFFGLQWFRRGIAIAILIFTFRLTEWAAYFAQTALAEKADLIGVAGIITATAAVPLGMLTLLFNNYNEKRKQDAPDAPPT